jgi:hypothetical protein
MTFVPQGHKFSYSGAERRIEGTGILEIKSVVVTIPGENCRNVCKRKRFLQDGGR